MLGRSGCWVAVTTIVAGALLGSSSSSMIQESLKPCEAREVIRNPEGREDYAEYNNLVCAGVAKLSRNEYAAAVELLERAFEINFFEDINYELYPRLALAYHLKGDQARAEELLEEAELALRLNAGLLRCQHHDSEGYVLVRRDGAKVSSIHHDRVRNRMCSVFTEEDYFEPRTLEEFTGKAELIKFYLDVRSRVHPQAK